MPSEREVFEAIAEEHPHAFKTWSPPGKDKVTLCPKDNRFQVEPTESGRVEHASNPISFYKPDDEDPSHFKVHYVSKCFNDDTYEKFKDYDAIMLKNVPDDKEFKPILQDSDKDQSDIVSIKIMTSVSAKKLLDMKQKIQSGTHYIMPQSNNKGIGSFNFGSAYGFDDASDIKYCGMPAKASGYVLKKTKRKSDDDDTKEKKKKKKEATIVDEDQE